MGDLGGGGSLHPSTKLEIGTRMATVVHSKVYGGEEVFEGPSPTKAVSVDGSVTVTFDMRGSAGWDIHVGQNCSFSQHGGNPKPLLPYLCKSYEVQGADGLWRDAEFSHLDPSGAVVVSSPIAEPVS